MRNILFRGKRVDNGAWAEGNLFIPDKVALIDAPTEILMGTNYVRISYEVDPATVGQYTGLTDENGVKIFEGDILEPDDEIYVAVVHYGGYGTVPGDEITNLGFYLRWNTKEKALLRCDFGYWTKKCKVIGNIHDNPELLEGGGGT